MSQQRFCQIHNIPLDPSWPACPYCLKEGRVQLPGGAPAGGAVGTTVPGPSPVGGPPGFGPPGPPPGGGAATVVRGGPGGGVPGGYGGDATRVGGAPGGGAYDPTRRAPAAGGGAGATIIDQPAEARAWLVVKEGEGAGGSSQWHPIAKKPDAPTDEITIGRDRENDVILIEGKVSRFHAKIRLEKDDLDNEQYVVWDLASSNGTFVNGERVRAPTPIKENDTIRVGTTTFVLKVVG